MSERRKRTVPERDLISRQIAYGSPNGMDIDTLLNEIAGKAELNKGKFYRDKYPSSVDITDQTD